MTDSSFPIHDFPQDPDSPVPVWHMDSYPDADLARIFDAPDQEDAAVADRAYMCGQIYTYNMPIPEGGEIEGVTQADVDAWLESLSPDERTEVEQHHQLAVQEDADASVVEARVREEMPELLEGRLPADLESLMPTADYVLGSSGQLGIETLDDARQYLVDNGGIRLDAGLTQRFLFFDRHTPGYAERAVTRGYYGPSICVRMITATPMPEEARAAATPNEPSLAGFVEQALEGHLLPQDYTIDGPSGRPVLNAKYLVGVVGLDGAVYRNAGFMRSDVAELGVPSPSTQ